TLALISNGRIVLWDVKTRKERTVIPLSGWRVLSVAFAPDGNSLAAGGSIEGKDKPPTCAWRGWDTATGREKPIPTEDMPGEIHSVAFSSKWVAFGGGHRWREAFQANNPVKRKGVLRLWKIASGRAPVALPVTQDFVHGVAFAPDGKTLACAGVKSK